MLGMLRAARGERRLDLGAVDDQRVGELELAEALLAGPWSCRRSTSTLSSTTISPALALAESACLQRQRAHLLGQLDGVAARLGPERLAAAAPLRHRLVAVAGAAGALLLVHLLAGDRDFRPVLARDACRPCASAADSAPCGGSGPCAARARRSRRRAPPRRRCAASSVLTAAFMTLLLRACAAAALGSAAASPRLAERAGLRRILGQRPLDRVAHQHPAALGAGHGAAHQHQAAVLVGLRPPRGSAW